MGVVPICTKCCVSDIYTGRPANRTHELKLAVFYNLNMHLHHLIQLAQTYG